MSTFRLFVTAFAQSHFSLAVFLLQMLWTGQGCSLKGAEVTVTIPISAFGAPGAGGPLQAQGQSF
jgi:hypothetical protein